MATKWWVRENLFGTEPNVQSGFGIETFARDQDGNMLIKTSTRAGRRWC